MDPVTLILGALAAGAAAGLTDTVTQAVKDAYGGLKALVVKKFAAKPLNQQMVEEFEKDPDTYAKPMEKELKAVGADQDAEVLALAEKLIELVKAQPGGGEIIKQTLTITGNARVGKVIQAGKIEGEINM